MLRRRKGDVAMLRLTLLEENGPDHEIEIPYADTIHHGVLDGDLSIEVFDDIIPASLQQKDLAGWDVVVSDQHQVATGSVRRADFLPGSRLRLDIRYTHVKPR